ncbi:competence protein CoiA [Cytobacillus sp. FSL H8-0458]|uniref:competence protein CoiA n=1 Tax=Cytobacillus sp. FSL H8-0458 TaxID=2975346 RepID=UPI004046D461
MRISLIGSHSILALQQYREKHNFYCPECKENVIMKIGKKKIPHFSHRKGSECPERYERESEYHISGKLLLFQWLKKKGLNPILEPYYPEILQRPDIGVHYEGVHYALEYQCSSISEELFIKRTEAYFQSGIVPIWILAGKSIKRIGKTKISLSGFQYLFIRQAVSGHWVIPSFCPTTKSFINIHHIQPLTVRNACAHYDVKPIFQAEADILFGPYFKNNINIDDWKREVRKIKNSLSQNSGAIKNKFLQDLYSCSIAPAFLPPEIGLPVRHSPFIETSPIQWQSYLFMDIVGKERPFSLSQMIAAFRKRVKNNDIKIRSIPLVQTGSEIHAIKEYLDVLINLNIVKHAEKGLYKKTALSGEPDHYCRIIQIEEDFYRRFSQRILQGK